MSRFRKYRERNRAYVDALRERTVCAVCGGQPIDWHHPDHKPGDRIAHVRVSNRSIATIQALIDECTPLCRRHHMEADGRLERLKASGGFKKGNPYGRGRPKQEGDE